MSGKTAIESGLPFLRWAGSKRQLIPELAEYWQPSYVRYVEPFAGSAALFFNLSPEKAILGDINEELIETYRQVQVNPTRVVSGLSQFRKSKNVYLHLRSVNPKTLSPHVRAARFIYLNRFCFNGLYRTNKKGQFNVPYSGDRTGSIPSAEFLHNCSLKLNGVRLIAGDFGKTLSYARKGDFVYMDPPFNIKSKRVFNEYDARLFNQNTLQRLRKWLLVLDNQDIPFLVSYADSDEATFLAHGFFTRKVYVRRNIAGFSGNRRKDIEILIFNKTPSNK